MKMNSSLLLVAFFAILCQVIPTTIARNPFEHKIRKRNLHSDHVHKNHVSSVADIISKSIDDCIIRCEEAFGDELNENLNEVIF